MTTHKKLILMIRNAAKDDFGGGERIPVFISKEINNHGEFNAIILSGSEKLSNFANKESVTCIKSWWWSRQNWSGSKVLLIPIYICWQVVLYIYYLFMYIKIKPSIVHIQSKDDFIAGTFAAKTLSIPVIWSDYADLKHIFMNQKIWYKNPIGKMVYFAANFTEKILVVSKEDESLVLNNINSIQIKDKIQIMYYGAFDVYNKIDKYDKFTFVSSSRIVVDKGIGELIDAFNKFNKLHKDTELLIIGEGKDRKRFETLANNNSVIKFLGYKNNPTEIVGKSHVFIIPTYHEGFSIALVEACMLNMPIIATNVGGNPEIIKDKITGLLIKSKDSNDLYRAMVILYEDTKLRKLIGDNARKQYNKNYNLAVIINKDILPIYRRISK